MHWVIGNHGSHGALCEQNSQPAMSPNPTTPPGVGRGGSGLKGDMTRSKVTRRPTTNTVWGSSGVAMRDSEPSGLAVKDWKPTFDLKFENGILLQRWEKPFRTMSEVTWYYEQSEDNREPREEWRQVPGQHSNG